MGEQSNPHCNWHCLLSMSHAQSVHGKLISCVLLLRSWYTLQMPQQPDHQCSTKVFNHVWHTGAVTSGCSKHWGLYKYSLQIQAEQ
jgi:hypothetical protein